MASPGSPSSSGAWEPPLPDELQGSLPHYEITGILGRGGMGAVYKGRQRVLEREVAIKVLPPGLASDSDPLRCAERFLQEARAMARLSHPGIVAVYDFGETAGGLLYFVMEFVDGMDVQHYLAHHGGRLAPDVALAIAAHLLDALDYAHARGIVHRDIKPANVLIDREGRIKVADFGLAKAFGEGVGDTSLTMSNVAVGTPDYIAPEALGFSQTPDHRADLYAVGVMLYRMLTGKLPRGAFKPPSRYGHGIAPALDAVVVKALAAEPDARHASAAELRADLEDALDADLEPPDGTAKHSDWPPAEPATTGVQERQHINFGFGLRTGSGSQPRSRRSSRATRSRSAVRTRVVASAVAAMAMLAVFFAAPWRAPEERSSELLFDTSVVAPQRAIANSASPTSATAKASPAEDSSDQPAQASGMPRQTATDAPQTRSGALRNSKMPPEENRAHELATSSSQARTPAQHLKSTVTGTEAPPRTPQQGRSEAPGTPAAETGPPPFAAPTAPTGSVERSASTQEESSDGSTSSATPTGGGTSIAPIAAPAIATERGAFRRPESPDTSRTPAVFTEEDASLAQIPGLAWRISQFLDDRNEKVRRLASIYIARLQAPMREKALAGEIATLGTFESEIVAFEQFAESLKPLSEDPAVLVATARERPGFPEIAEDAPEALQEARASWRELATGWLNRLYDELDISLEELIAERARLRDQEGARRVTAYAESLPAFPLGERLWTRTDGSKIRGHLVDSSAHQTRLTLASGGDRITVPYSSLTPESQAQALALAQALGKHVPTTIALEIELLSEAEPVSEAEVTVTDESDGAVLLVTPPGSGLAIDCGLPPPEGATRILTFSAEGFVPVQIPVKYEDGVPSLDRRGRIVELFPRRYVTLRLTYDTSGSRSLRGDDLEEIRVALSHNTSIDDLGIRVVQHMNPRDPPPGLGLSLVDLANGESGPVAQFLPIERRQDYESMRRAPSGGFASLPRALTSDELGFFVVNDAERRTPIFGKYWIEEIGELPPDDVEVKIWEPGD